jgi:16S rRNA (cytosine967-C5)-methyltransferase
LIGKRPLDLALAQAATRPETAGLDPRDRALARLIVATALRRQGELEHVLNAFLERPLPADNGLLWPILLAGAAQLICLDMPAHAVVDLAVEAMRRDRSAHRFAKLTNAVMRRVAERGPSLLADLDRVRLNIPDWLWQRWSASYGDDGARLIAEASLREAPLDISLKPAADATCWSGRLGGQVLPTGSIRLASSARVEDLPGYADGVWWVQDAAAALIAPLAGKVAGRTVADLCAAPGGKTAGLAAAGAKVTAVDVSASRLNRLRQNLSRLQIDAEIICADAQQWSPARMFDVVVLDAPCSATGTIRRHPDILRLKQTGDVSRMADLQRAMLRNAASLVVPGGLLLYSTCSLEREEGEDQSDVFLAEHPEFARIPISADELGGSAPTPRGELRTLPFHMRLDPPELSGMDGFYAVRLQRTR